MISQKEIGRIDHHSDYLQALRGCFLILGILVHAATVEHHWSFGLMTQFSELFRMEGFFLLSGYLAAMTMAQQNTKIFLIRSLWLAAPLCFTLVFINPITNALAAQYHNYGVPFETVFMLFWSTDEILNGPMNWYLHLWCFILLILYAMLHPAINGLYQACQLMLKQLPEKLRRYQTQIVVFLLPLSLLLFFHLLVSVLNNQIIEEVNLNIEIYYLVKEFFINLPFYLLGYFLFRHQAILHYLSKIKFSYVIFASLLLGFSHFISRTPGFNQSITETAKALQVLSIFSQFFFAIIFSGYLLTLWLKYIAHFKQFAVSLSKAAFSIYFLQYFVIYILAISLNGWFDNLVYQYIVIVLLTFAITYFVHSQIINHFKITRLLLDNKQPQN